MASCAYDDVIYVGPKTMPICHLNELLEWTEPQAPEGVDGSVADDEKHCYLIPKRIKRTVDVAETTDPLTLVCHDMKGGYIDDHINNGHNNALAYRFTHWSLVDIFIYFSHHMVTIPPIAWTTVAHRNGVRCFGTFIIEEPPETEVDEGRFLREYYMGMVNKTLADVETVEKVTSILARIAAFYRFDGWLVNIEAPMAKEKIPLMELFLRSLRAKTKAILGLPERDIAVIWYDAVTSDDGSLAWQNELNFRNQEFFAASDAIFLNYCWTEEHLDRCWAHLHGRYGHRAGRRLHNRVFVGIDVFGRGCFGGGGFFSNIALREARHRAFSAAIFAPGWTWEILGPDNFTANDNRLWERLSRYIRERLFDCLPIRTSFCEGVGGSGRYDRGQRIDSKPWCDLRQQSKRPVFISAEQARMVHHDAWQGGGSLRINTSSTLRWRSFTVFKLAVPVDLRHRYHYQLIYKNSHPGEVMVTTGLSIEEEVAGSGPESGSWIYILDLDPADLEVPAVYSSLIRSVTYHQRALDNGWLADDFLIELNEDKVDTSGKLPHAPPKNDEASRTSKKVLENVLITNVRISLRRTDRATMSSAELLKAPGFEVLLGAITLE